MDLRFQLSRLLLLPIGKTYSGRKYFKAISLQHFLEKTQYWEPDKIKDLRNQQFRKIIAHCYKNVPFYQQYMDKNKLTVKDFETIEDIIKLPILTKEIINNNQTSLTAANYHKKNIRNDNSGGTTGIPIQFGRDKINEFRVDANNWRFWKYAEYIPGSKVALFWGNEIELLRAETLHSKLKRFMENTKMLNFYDLSKNRLDEYTDYINKSKPKFIRGYATAIHLYVQYCKENNITLSYHPKSIIVTCDKIFKAQKKQIEDFFNCEVFEEYGCREFSILAHECEAHAGFHLAEEHFIFEVLNPQSQRCSFVGKGEILVTSLFNYAMPLLRYRLGDEVTITSKPCTCGRTLKILSNINGRIADFVITKSGKYIYGELFAHLFCSAQGISKYQVQQFEKGKIVINIIRNKKFKNNVMSEIIKDFKKIVGSDLLISCEYVNEIKPSPSGKRRSVISHISSQYLPPSN